MEVMSKFSNSVAPVWIKCEKTDMKYLVSVQLFLDTPNFYNQPQVVMVKSIQCELSQKFNLFL